MGLREIFWSTKDAVTGEWRGLRCEELNDMYCSANVIRLVKSRRMRWTERVARMSREEMGAGV